MQYRKETCSKAAHPIRVMLVFWICVLDSDQVAESVEFRAMFPSFSATEKHLLLLPHL